MKDTGFPMCSFRDSGKPSGILRKPSKSSEYAINSDLYPKFSRASFTPYALTASPRLPMCGIPDAPSPLSTLIRSVFLPSDFSLCKRSYASLSIQVPLPIICCSSSVISNPLTCMDQEEHNQVFYNILLFLPRLSLVISLNQTLLLKFFLLH